MEIIQTRHECSCLALRGLKVLDQTLIQLVSCPEFSATLIIEISQYTMY